MKIQSINSQNFCANTKYIRPDAYRDMQVLLNKMNGMTILENNNDSFESTVLHKVEIRKDNESVRFYDDRGLVKKNQSKEALSLGESIIEMDDAFIKVSNLDGKIVDYDKPWYKSFDKLVVKAEEYIKTAVSNFENRKVVSHGYSSVPVKNVDGFGRVVSKIKIK
ncbi:hypothetical protein IJO12_00690 [bacterium]|nr:hypothetical protein [bacterium]